MSDRKRFSHPWHDFRPNALNEAATSTMQGAIGAAKPEKKLQAIEELPPKCNPELLQRREYALDDETLKAVAPNGFEFYTTNLGCFLIDGNAKGAEEMLADVKAPGLVGKIEEITGFERSNIKDFFSLSAIAPAPAPESHQHAPERYQHAPVTEVEDYAIGAQTISPETMKPSAAPTQADERSVRPARAAATTYLEGKLTELFNGIALLHVRFLLGNAMIIYWRTLVSDDIMDLKSQPELAENARMIAEIEIDWLLRMLRGLKPKVDTITKVKQKAIKWTPPTPGTKEKEADQFVHKVALITFLKKLRRSSGINFEPHAARAALKPVFDNALGTPLTIRERAEKPSIVKLDDMHKKLMEIPYADKASRASGTKISQEEAWKVANAVADWLEKTQHVNIKVARRGQDPSDFIDPGPTPQAPGAPPTSHGFMVAGTKGLAENKQNQRWKYLAGIK